MRVGIRQLWNRRTRLAVWALSGAMLTPVAPAAADAACANGQPDARPAGKGQQVLVDYFAAVNSKDYLTAWGYLGRQVRSAYGAIAPEQDADGLASFSSSMRQHVRCVRVTAVTGATMNDPEVSASLGIQWYQVTFDAEYLSRFESGAAALPRFYKTQADPHDGVGPPPLIVNQAMSP